MMVWVLTGGGQGYRIVFMSLALVAWIIDNEWVQSGWHFAKKKLQQICSWEKLGEIYSRKMYPKCPRKLGALDLHARSTTLEIKICSCTRGQEGRTVALRLVQTVKRDPSLQRAFVRNKDENAKYKKSLFLH